MSINDITGLRFINSFKDYKSRQELSDGIWRKEITEAVINGVEYNILTIEQNGGDGTGDRADMVIRLENTDVYIQITIPYSSYDGFDFRLPIFERVEPCETDVAQWLKFNPKF